MGVNPQMINKKEIKKKNKKKNKNKKKKKKKKNKIYKKKLNKLLINGLVFEKRNKTNRFPQFFRVCVAWMWLCLCVLLRSCVQ